MANTAALIDRLFFAIAFSEHSDTPHLQHIQQHLAAGLAPDVYSKAGQTPLTAAILGGMGSPKAVNILLEHGANPSWRDQQGFTPWAAMRSRYSDVVVADRMAKIKRLLEAYQADSSDEIFFVLQEAVQHGDLRQVEELLKQGVNPNQALINPLAVAVSKQDIKMVELLLSYQANTERGAQGYTVLMQAAEQGNIALIKTLVQAGAKVEAFAWHDPRCRADWLAAQSGHWDAAHWLKSQLPAGLAASLVEELAERHPKYAELYEKNTNGANYDLETDAIVHKLTEWDRRFSIEISEVSADALTVRFESLPDAADFPAFVEEIYQFCPDVIDQHFGCFDDLLDQFQKTGQPLDPELEKLIAGVDFSQDDFGQVLLRRSLQQRKFLHLWWD